MGTVQLGKEGKIPTKYPFIYVRIYLCVVVYILYRASQTCVCVVNVQD